MKLASSLALVAVAACSSFAAGCADTTEESVDEGTAELAGIGVPNPSGAYFAAVRANGSGCPKGSYDANISPDGQTFTVTFNAFEGSVEAGQSLAVKDCNLSIDLQSPQGLSFTVSSFLYQGYALLTEPGMSARQTAKYYFMGNP